MIPFSFEKKKIHSSDGNNIHALLPYGYREVGETVESCRRDPLLPFHSCTFPGREFVDLDFDFLLPLEQLSPFLRLY